MLAAYPGAPASRQHRVTVLRRSVRQCDVLVLLVTADFLASPETDTLMVEAASSQAHAVPVLLRPCDWQGTPLGKRQALPRDQKAILLRRGAAVDAAWVEVATEIREVVSLSSPAATCARRSSPAACPKPGFSISRSGAQPSRGAQFKWPGNLWVLCVSVVQAGRFR